VTKTVRGGILIYPKQCRLRVWSFDAALLTDLVLREYLERVDHA
jgi:hypothetical protein